MNKYHTDYSIKHSSWVIYESVGPGIFKVVEKGLETKEDAEFYIEILIGMNEP